MLKTIIIGPFRLPISITEIGHQSDFNPPKSVTCPISADREFSIEIGSVADFHRYLSNIDSVLLWNLVTTFVKKSAPKFSAWPQLFKFLYQFTFWIVLIFLIFFLFLSPNLIFAFWNATWWHFKIFHKNLNLRFLFNNLSHWWKSKQFAPKF